MRKFLLLSACLFSILTSSALSTTSVFEEAGNAYIKGDYKTAVLLYEQILSEQQVTNAELHFNLGNAYFKLTDYPNAILNYERSLKLIPDDADVRFNLALANLRIEDKIEQVPDMFYKRWFVSLRGMAGADTWGILFLISLALCSAGFFLYVLSNSIVIRKTGFFGGICLLLLSITFLGLGISMYSKQTSHTEAIVFSGSVSVKSSPVESGTGLFVIHAGTKVQLTDELGDWVKIHLADGNEGWLPLADLERI
jgi:tetratricopeptide (TPR) repeat protein